MNRTKHCIVCNKVIRHYNKSGLCEGCSKKTPKKRAELINKRENDLCKVAGGSSNSK